jgi:hypothetical protein
MPSGGTTTPGGNDMSAGGFASHAGRASGTGPGATGSLAPDITSSGHITLLSGSPAGTEPDVMPPDIAGGSASALAGGIASDAKGGVASAGGTAPNTRSVLRSGAIAFTSGLMLGALPYLSYGLLSIFALPLAVLIRTRPRRAVLIALLTGCLVIPTAFTLAGFNWWDGMQETHAAWAAGAGSRRPYAYFLIGDLAVLALITGPATAYAVKYLKGNLRTLIIAAAIGVIALDISGVTRGEVERIWLPYAAWMTATAAATPATKHRKLLIAQALTALIIEAVVSSPW